MFDLKKADGDTWISVRPLVTNKYFFSYKYVILEVNQNNKKFVDWERGVDRIADCEIMKDQNASSSN